MFYSDLVRKAAQISFEAHKYDKDKSGYPYFMHPMTLAVQFDDEASVCVALLHDVVEDHGDKYSFEYLKEQGFAGDILDALRLLTHERGVDYLDYVREIKKNPIATKVKLVDLRHNTDLSRCGGAKPPKYELYLKAIDYLEGKTDELKKDEPSKSRIGRTYYCILSEMMGDDYNANDAEKKLAREIRKYLLDVFNSHVAGGSGKFYDPIFACSVKAFYGHYLSWDANSWKRSAEIVYSYFKAKTLMDCIHQYESMLGKVIIHDYDALLEYFYKAIKNNEEIDYWKGPGIDAAFEVVPEKTLNDKLQKFKELYE